MRKKEKGQTPGKFRLYMMNFIRAMLIIAFVGAWRNDRPLILLISVIALFVTFLPMIIERVGLKIPGNYEVIIILFIFGTLFFGEVRGFYAEFWWWSILLKMGAAIALGLVGFTILYALYKDEKIDASPAIIALFAFSFAVSIGVMWEIFEFMLDKILGFSLQEKRLTTTMGDIIGNAIGAFLVSIVGYYYIKEGKKNIFSKFVSNLIERNPKLFKSRREVSEEKIKKLIGEGESGYLEFKSTLRKNLHTNEIDKKVEHAVLKTMVSYLNSNGGIVLVGISDKGEIIGVENDGFENDDKLALHLSNLIKHRIGSEFVPFIQFEIVKINDKSIVKIDCSKSKKHVFLKTDEGEEFYVRYGPSTVRLDGSVLIDYIDGRFKNKD